MQLRPTIFGWCLESGSGFKKAEFWYKKKSHKVAGAFHADEGLRVLVFSVMQK
jgi:hypothetical protein